MSLPEKRKRSQNFVAKEKYKLVKLLASQKDAILNKKTDVCTSKAKMRAWMRVTNAFNSSTTIHRSKDSLMKLWANIKSDSKIYCQTSRRETATNGEPSDVKVDPLLEQVCALLGWKCIGIEGEQYCDADASPKVDKVTPITILSVDDINENIDKYVTQYLEEEEEDNCVSPIKESKLPMWSRKSSRIAQTNERIEAMSALCSSFSNVNKKKENIEDLKKQLLQEEINFKRKLYSLQLQAAEKEVEIKTEILNQLKG